MQLDTDLATQLVLVLNGFHLSHHFKCSTSFSELPALLFLCQTNVHPNCDKGPELTADLNFLHTWTCFLIPSSTTKKSAPAPTQYIGNHSLYSDMFDYEGLRCCCRFILYTANGVHTLYYYMLRVRIV